MLFARKNVVYVVYVTLSNVSKESWVSMQILDLIQIHKFSIQFHFLFNQFKLYNVHFGYIFFLCNAVIYTDQSF